IRPARRSPDSPDRSTSPSPRSSRTATAYRGECPHRRRVGSRIVIDLDLLRASQRARREPESVVDTLLAADEARRAAVAGFEAARAEQKQLGKQVPRATGAEREELLRRAGDLAR